MSVLVEALSLVVPRLTLDVSYPGGADRFIESLESSENPARFVVADDDLVSVSFFCPDEAKTVALPLLEHGLIGVDDGAFVDFVFVDQRFGPTMPCPWLGWERHPEGFTLAWRASSEPGELAVPEGWTPEQSKRLTREDIREEPGRCMKLAEEEGVETWIDFSTGELIVGLSHREEGGDVPATHACAAASADTSSAGEEVDLDEIIKAMEEEEARKTSLLELVRQALVEGGVTPHQSAENTLVVRVREAKSVYDVCFVVDPVTDYLGSSCLLAPAVPMDRRLAVAEALTRINYKLRLGAYEMSFDRGDLRFRIGVDVEDGTVSPAMIHNIVGASIFTCERYHDALMKVAYGGADPRIVEAVGAE